MTQSDRPGHPHQGRHHHPDPQQDLPLLSGGLLNRRLLLRALVVLAALLIALILIMLTGRGTSDLLNSGVRPSPLFTIPGPGRGDDPLFSRPLSAGFSESGQIYVSDTGNQRVCVFSDRGAFVREFGRTKQKDGTYQSSLEQPAGLAVSPDGHVYVADVRGGAVVVFDSRGNRVNRITSAGPSTLGVWAPTDVALSGDRLYVTDAAGVGVFSAAGQYIRRMDKSLPGTAFSHPNGIAVRPDGTLVVSDTNNGRVIAMKPDGSHIWTAGPDAGKQRIIGLPRGLAVATKGDVLVADAFLFSVVRISSAGTYKDSYGARGTGTGELSFPNDVDVHGEVVAITDKENNRIQVIKFPGL